MLHRLQYEQNRAFARGGPAAAPYSLPRTLAPRGRVVYWSVRCCLLGRVPAWLVRPLPSAASSTSGARRGFRAFVPSRCGGPRAAAAYRYPTVQPIVRTGHCTYTELKACRNASLRQTTRNGEPACDGAVWRARSLESRVS